jgi:hypothetical protein
LESTEKVFNAAKMFPLFGVTTPAKMRDLSRNLRDRNDKKGFFSAFSKL